MKSLKITVKSVKAKFDFELHVQRLRVTVRSCRNVQCHTPSNSPIGYSQAMAKLLVDLLWERFRRVRLVKLNAMDRKEMKTSLNPLA